MRCNKCNREIDNNSSFCSYCGAKIDNSTSIVQSVNNQGVVNSYSKEENYSKISLILGIIALVMVLINYFLTIICGIVSIVFGVMGHKTTKKKAGIILSIVSIVAPIIIGILLIFLGIKTGFFEQLYKELNYATSENYVVGKYNCVGYSSFSSDDDRNYKITLHLNKDNTFFYGPYGDTTNNYAKGKYSFEDEKKTNNSGEYKYFMITFEGDKSQFIVNGQPSENDFNSKAEFGITTVNAKKEGILMFTNTYNMYYCYSE